MSYISKNFCLEEERLEAYECWKITYLFKDIDLLVWGMGNLNQYHILKILCVIIFCHCMTRKGSLFFLGRTVEWEFGNLPLKILGMNFSVSGLEVQPESKVTELARKQWKYWNTFLPFLLFRNLNIGQVIIPFFLFFFFLVQCSFYAYGNHELSLSYIYHCHRLQYFLNLKRASKPA